MTNYLVVTAIGTDRPGIVNELTKLVTNADCNIVDSRMAVFGNECTLILLLSGQWNAITHFETALSAKSAQLELITLMKRTSEHQLVKYSHSLSINLQGNDAPDCAVKFTEYLTKHTIDLAGLRTEAKDGYQHIEMIVNIPQHVDVTNFKNDFNQLAHDLNLTINFNL